jgi:predicted nuclease of predicted toxin-antitoxin system
MNILIDMNLSPDWVAVFSNHGIAAVHWASVGDPGAEDSALMDWARAHRFIVFTHDLDFGAALALTQAESPSVIQVRTQDVTPAHLETTIIEVLQHYESLLETGALIVIDEGRSRVRILPLKRSS